MNVCMKLNHFDFLLSLLSHSCVLPEVLSVSFAERKTSSFLFRLTYVNAVQVSIDKACPPPNITSHMLPLGLYAE